MEEFRGAGFEIGAFVANNFSITGPPELFARYFGIPVGDDRPASLPLGSLPEPLKALVQAVGFPRGYSSTSDEY